MLIFSQYWMNLGVWFHAQLKHKIFNAEPSWSPMQCLHEQQSREMNTTSTTTTKWYKEITLLSEVHLTFISSFSTTNINYLLRLSNLDDCFFCCVFFLLKSLQNVFFCSLKFSAVEQAEEFNFLFLFLAVFVVQGRIINLL